MSLIVSDASPLIALQQIERLDLLQTIFGRLVIPPAVAREAASVPLGDWIAIRSLEVPLPSTITGAGLGAGESEVWGSPSNRTKSATGGSLAGDRGSAASRAPAAAWGAPPGAAVRR